MAQRTLNKSRQRDAIYNYLKTRTDHPTADMIHKALLNDMPNISLGTVYRNLTLLVELGKIIKISCGDNSEHFDADISPHYHFICRNCNCVQDIFIPPFEGLNETASKAFDGKIEDHNIYFSGVCKACLETEATDKTKL